MKIVLVILLFISNGFGYTFDGLKSGKTVYKLYKESITGRSRVSVYASALNPNKNIAFAYKEIFGEQAEITLYFTEKSKKLYKTKIYWIKPFFDNSVIYKQKKEKFYQKIKILLSKKYGKPMIRKGEVEFSLQNKSFIKLVQDELFVKLIYIDRGI